MPATMALWLAEGELGKLRTRSDGWQNNYTGMGTTRDKTTFSQIAGLADLPDSTLENLYACDDVAGRAIDIVPDDCFRAGYYLEINDKGKERAAQDRRAELGADEKMLEADAFGRLYGECLLIMGADDQQSAMLPLSAEKAKNIDFLEVLDRRYYYPVSYYSRGPKAGQPEIYSIANPGPSPRPGFMLHESRCIVYGGARTTITEKRRRNWRDHSILQRPYEVIRSFATGFNSLETLLTDGPQGVYKIKNLAHLLSAHGQDALEARIQAIDLFRSYMRAIVIDAEGETFERQAVNFSGLGDAFDQLAMRLAAALDMPVSKLMGRAPQGMNATGEFDERRWNSKIQARQTNYHAPRVRRLNAVLLGVAPGEIEVCWNPLWSASGKEIADERSTTATTDKIYFEIGALSPEQIARMRFGMRGWQPGYSLTDEERTALDAAIKLDQAKTKDVPRNPDLLTATAKETIVTVNEARANEGLDPVEEAIGARFIAQQRAMLEASAAVEGEAQGKENAGIEDTPLPANGSPGTGTPPQPGAKVRPFDAPPAVDSVPDSAPSVRAKTEGNDT